MSVGSALFLALSLNLFILFISARSNVGLLYLIYSGVLITLSINFLKLLKFASVGAPGGIGFKFGSFILGLNFNLKYGCPFVDFST